MVTYFGYLYKIGSNEEFPKDTTKGNFVFLKIRTELFQGILYSGMIYHIDIAHYPIMR